MIIKPLLSFTRGGSGVSEDEKGVVIKTTLVSLLPISL